MRVRKPGYLAHGQAEIAGPGVEVLAADRGAEEDEHHAALVAEVDLVDVSAEGIGVADRLRDAGDEVVLLVEGEQAGDDVAELAEGALAKNGLGDEPRHVLLAAPSRLGLPGAGGAAKCGLTRVEPGAHSVQASAASRTAGPRK